MGTINDDFMGIPFVSEEQLYEQLDHEELSHLFETPDHLLETPPVHPGDIPKEVPSKVNEHVDLAGFAYAAEPMDVGMTFLQTNNPRIMALASLLTAASIDFSVKNNVKNDSTDLPSVQICCKKSDLNVLKAVFSLVEKVKPEDLPVVSIRMPDTGAILDKNGKLTWDTPNRWEGV